MASDLTVTWQQMDLNLLILSGLYRPSVFALLMFEVQMDVTINHDLGDNEGRCSAAGRKVTSFRAFAPLAGAAKVCEVIDSNTPRWPVQRRQRWNWTSC